jgi:hypothetical protein
LCEPRLESEHDLLAENPSKLSQRAVGIARAG